MIIRSRVLHLKQTFLLHGQFFWTLFLLCVREIIFTFIPLMTALCSLWIVYQRSFIDNWIFGWCLEKNRRIWNDDKNKFESTIQKQIQKKMELSSMLLKSMTWPNSVGGLTPKQNFSLEVMLRSRFILLYLPVHEAFVLF